MSSKSLSLSLVEVVLALAVASDGRRLMTRKPALLDVASIPKLLFGFYNSKIRENHSYDGFSPFADVNLDDLKTNPTITSSQFYHTTNA